MTTYKTLYEGVAIQGNFYFNAIETDVKLGSTAGSKSSWKKNLW